MKLAGKTGNKKLTPEDEMAAADFLISIGVIYNKVPFIWTKPVIHYDVIVMKPDVMRILKIEQVELAPPRKNAKPELVEGSQREIPLDSLK
jgi:hypothetical protein